MTIDPWTAPLSGIEVRNPTKPADEQESPADRPSVAADSPPAPGEGDGQDTTPPDAQRAAEPLDLAEIIPWLAQCGACDAGLPMGCAHPEGDYRPVMARLVDEVQRLRADLDSLGHWVCANCESIPPGVDEDGMTTCCGNQAEWFEPDTLTSVKAYAARVKQARNDAWDERDRLLAERPSLAADALRRYADRHHAHPGGPTNLIQTLTIREAAGAIYDYDACRSCSARLDEHGQCTGERERLLLAARRIAAGEPDPADPPRPGIEWTPEPIAEEADRG